MKVKNIFFSVVLSGLLLTNVFTVSSCGNNKPKEEQYKIYELAKQSGYHGTYEEWLESIKGADGKDGREIELSIEQNKIVWRYKGESNWKLIYSVNDLIGPKGEPGKDGVSITKIVKTNTNELVDTYIIIFSDGSTSNFVVTNGKDGEQGIQGVPGKDGTTPTVSINANGYWVINNIATKIKAEGQAGADGKSAYELYKEVHPEYKGTLEEWLDDLVTGRLNSDNKVYHTVKFITGTDDVIANQKIEHYHRVEKPAAITRDGYEFLGWYVNDEKWSFVGFSVVDDITLTAKWRELRLSVQTERMIDPIYFSRSAINPNEYYIKNFTFTYDYLHFKFDNESIKIKLKPGENNLYATVYVPGHPTYRLHNDNSNILLKLTKIGPNSFEAWASGYKEYIPLPSTSEPETSEPDYSESSEDSSYIPDTSDTGSYTPDYSEDTSYVPEPSDTGSYTPDYSEDTSYVPDTSDTGSYTPVYSGSSY